MSIGRDRQGFTTLNGARVYWPANTDAAGARTFLLPGETSIDSLTMRQRTTEYYRQIRGGANLEAHAAGLRAISEAKALIAEQIAQDEKN